MTQSLFILGDKLSFLADFPSYLIGQNCNNAIPKTVPSKRNPTVLGFDS